MLGFIGLFLMTRYFTGSTYGQIAYTISLVGIFFSLSDLGFATAHIKRINEGKDLGDCISSYLTVKLLLVGATISIILGALWVWMGLMQRPLSDTSLELVAVFILYFVVYNIAAVATSTFDAFQKTAKTQVALIFEMLVRVPLIFFFAIPLGTTYALAWCYALGGITVLIVSMSLLSHEHIHLKRPTLIRSYSVFAMPLAISVIVGIIIANIDKVALGFFWNPVEVANYAASQSIVNMVLVFGTALSTLLLPTFSRLHERGQSDTMRELVRLGERYLSFILTPIVCVMLVFPVMIATVLLSDKYSEAAGVVQVLSLVILVYGLSGVYSAHLVAANRAKDMVWLSFVQLAMLGLFLILFVPTAFYGNPMLGLRAVGTALAFLIAALITTFLLRVLVWRLIGLGFNRRMGFHLLAALVTVMALFGMGLVYTPTRWYDIILSWLVASAVFYSILFAFKELERKDIRYFAKVLSPREMLRYLRSDLRRGPNN